VWFIFRPDAVNVWKNKEVFKRYQRYRGILDGAKKARYLLVKRMPIDCSLEKDTLEELWAEHERLAEEFPKLLRKLDGDQITLDELPAHKKSFLELKEEIAWRILRNCHFCERRCGIDRSKGEIGVCRVGQETIVSSAFLHTGEESVLVPSGTIFFAGCTFKCAFCQNYDISQEWKTKNQPSMTAGVVTDAKRLSLLEEQLWKEGAKNINFVGGDPTPNLHTIIASLKYLQANITLLWNSNNYQSLEATKLLLELMDFWLPDFKFWENDFAKKISGVDNYREIVSRNIKLAYEAGSGEVLVRHLLMPGRVEADTIPILEWCAKEIPNAMVNLMDQYHPDYLIIRQPDKYHALNRRILPEEWKRATKKADELGIFWRPVS